MKYIHRLFLFGMGCLLGLLLAEGVARCVLPYPSRQIALLRMRAPDLQMDAGTDLKNPNYNPFLQRRPHSEWICDGSLPELMNNEGFRDRDFQLSKESGKIRIAVLGDSFTEGWMRPRMAAFPRVLESKLGSGYEILNFGLANRSPLRYLALYHQIVRKYHPDIVLVCLYRNDVAEDQALRPYVNFDASGIPERFDYPRYFKNTPRMPQTKWEKRRDKYQWYLCKHSRLYPYIAVALAVDPEFRKRILETPSMDSFESDWANTASYLRKLRDLVKDDRAEFLLTYAPDQADFHHPDPLRERLDQLSKQEKIPCFNAADFLKSSNAASLYIPGDGHFSVLGHSCFANGLEAWIKSTTFARGGSGAISRPTPKS